MISLLIAFHSYRIHYTRKTKRNANREDTKLWKLLDLKYISYIVLISYLLRSCLDTSTSTIDSLSTTNHLNNVSCNAILRISNTMGLIGRFGIHLFVAVRCRLSSYKKQLTIWMKIGFLMLASDVFIILSVWVYYPSIVPIHDGTSCVIESYHWIYVFWVIGNDIIISLYCVLVFVWPLRKIISAERQAREEEITASDVENGKLNRKRAGERTMEDFVKRIIFCSIVASLGIVISCGIASISITTAAGPYIVEIEAFIGCWMIVMQFKDIDPRGKGINKFWSVIITLFQWDYWCCCPCYIYRGIEDETTKGSNINKNMKNQIHLHSYGHGDNKDHEEVIDSQTEPTENEETQTQTTNIDSDRDTNVGIKVPVDMKFAQSFSSGDAREQ